MSGVPSLSSAVTSSPVRYSVQGSQQFAASHMNASDMKGQLASELYCHWVGPMPVDAFFDAFLNIDHKDLAQMPTLPDDYFNAIPKTKKEPDMYQPFIELVTNSHIAPTLKLLDTSNHEDKEAEATMKNKPDITAYDTNANVTAAQPLSYSKAEVIFELKPESKRVDPFQDLSEQGTQADLHKFIWEPTAEGRRKCRGQLACYARAWMARQHRTHCFVVWIGDPYARIVRLDRSGAIVTECFNIRSQSRLLLQFLWRISCASAAMRGKDTTISVVTDQDEVELAKTKLAHWKPEGSWDVMKLKIPDGGPVDQPHMRDVLVWGPLADPHCVVGRATRGYPGWDLKDEKLVFVKDSWRVLGADISKETDILKTLNKAEVRYVPTYLCGDDIPGQTTRTQEFAGADWNRGGQPKTFSTRVHIRFTSDLIGTPLTKFTSSKQFLQAWLHALLAHQEAYTKCGILHRDISLNNILVKLDGEGFLNDWDLARTLADIEAGPRQPSRSGTWQFMSVYILRTPDTMHTLQDDLESFFWLLLYVTLRHLRTSIAPTAVASVMRTIFDATNVIDGTFTGGQNKDQVIQYRSYLKKDFSVQNNIPLSVLIDDILRILRSYHQFWASFSDNVEALAEEKGISLESAEEIHRTKAGDLKLCSHIAMVELTRKALGKDWPTGDRCSDLCKPEALGSGLKRGRTVDGTPDGAPTSGSDAQKRRKV